MIAKAAQGFSEVGAVGGDHATFPGGDVLHRVEAEDGHVRDAAHAAAAVFGAESMAGVFDHDQAMPIGEFQDRVQIGGMAGVVDRAELLACSS